jgi:predicted glycosyltransferase
MKRTVIWIDIENSPHVPFFLPIIEELRARKIELILTARDMYQTCELLEFFKLRCKVIGGHHGKSKLAKALYNCVRALQLVPTVLTMRPNIALSHGSRAQVLTCKIFRIPTLMMHDYEYSTKTGFIEPDWVMVPEIIDSRLMSRKGERVLKYPGLKEDVYVPRFKPDPSILHDLGIDDNCINVTVRPPAQDSHYHTEETEHLFHATMNYLEKKEKVRVLMLPRNAKQTQRLGREYSSMISTGRLTVPERPLDGLNAMWFSDLVISAGGTMNREAAALGVPVYSIFRGKIGAVDNRLAAEGRLKLIQSVAELNEISLAKWDRPAGPASAARPALPTIVAEILKITEGYNPTRGAVADSSSRAYANR